MLVQRETREAHETGRAPSGLNQCLNLEVRLSQDVALVIFQGDGVHQA
jgi:hypothetical protein